MNGLINQCLDNTLKLYNYVLTYVNVVLSQDVANEGPHYKISFRRPKRIHFAFIATFCPKLILSVDRRISKTWCKLSACLQKI